MKRRAFMTLLGGAAAWLLGARDCRRTYPRSGESDSRSVPDERHI
jgi:hypothetical protein